MAKKGARVTSGKRMKERPPFRMWLADRLSKYAMMKAFGEERTPQNETEEEELADIVASIWSRCQALAYKPHPKQKLFHESRVAQIRGSFARNQGGKTTAGEMEILSWGFGEDIWTGQPIEKIGKTKWRPEMRFFIGAQDYSNAHAETIIPKMEELLPLKEMGVEYVKQNGKLVVKLKFPEPYSFSIKLISYDQEEHKNEGPTWNGGWFDEPPPRGVYTACRRGCMKHAAPIIFTATPLREPWMYDEIYATPKSVHLDAPEDLKKLRWDTPAIIKIGRNDNPYITEEQMAAYESTLDEEEKQARIYGEFLHLQGRVYKSFDRTKHVLDRDQFISQHPGWKDYPSFCVVDPHDRKPFAISWGIVTPRDETIFVDEWPNFDFAKQKSWKWSVDEYLTMMREKEKALWGREDGTVRELYFRIMDPNFGRTPKAGSARTLEDEFADRGVYFDTTVDDDLSDGHLAVRSDLYNNRLFFFSNCTNTIKAMENYIWDEYRGSSGRAPKERPRDNFKDFADLVRYARKSPVFFFKKEDVVSTFNINEIRNGGLG